MMRWLIVLLPGGLLIGAVLMAYQLRARRFAKEASALDAQLLAKRQALQGTQAAQRHDEALAKRTTDRRREAELKRREAAAIESGQQRPRLVRGIR